MTIPSRTAVPALLASFLMTGPLLAGCGGDGGTGTASAQNSPAPSSSSALITGTPASGAETVDDGATDVPPFPADSEADTAAASPDAQVTVSDIRVGRQDGFDRVVLEVGGQGLPGWDVRYVDQASSQGSGEAVEVAGNAVLQMSITGAGYPYATGVEEFPRGEPVSAEGTGTVTEVVFDATFEGTTVAFVGTTAKAPFRVYLLEAPTRVVLEVAHAG